MQFLCELFKKLVKFLKCMGGSHIQHISNRFCRVTFISSSKMEIYIDGGGRECNYSLTILKENCLLLDQLLINFSHTIDAKIEKHACMHMVTGTLSIVIMATHFKIFTNIPFWYNSGFSDFSQKCNFSVNYIVNCLELLEWIAGTHMQHISNGFCHVTVNLNSHPGMDILMVGVGLFMIDKFFKEIGPYFSYPSTSPILLMLDLWNKHSWFT